METSNIRQIYLFNEISPSCYNETIKPLLEERNKYDVILLYMNSYGGDTEIGYSIIEALQLLKKKIITINLGLCYSMAQVVYLCGDIRLCTPSAKFMIHETSYYHTSPKSVGSLEKEIKETIRLDDKLNNYIIKKTKLTKKSLGKILETKEDYYYGSSEAINNGTTHRIIRALSLKHILKGI